MDKLGDVDSPSTKAYVALAAKHRAIDLYRNRKHCEPIDASGGAAQAHPECLGVMEAISQLPPRDRDVLLLCFWVGYTTEEIAGMLHMKKDAVQKAIWRVKKARRHTGRELKKRKKGNFSYYYGRAFHEENGTKLAPK